MSKKRYYLRYSCAILAVPLAIGLRYAMTPLVGNGVPYISLFMVTTGVAMFAGMGPAILTSVLAAIFTEYFFIPPLCTFALDLQFFAQMGVIILTSACIGYVSDSLRKARERAERNAGLLRESDTKYRHLVNYAGFIVVRCRLDGTIIFINDMGCQYVDRKSEDVVGRGITEIWGQQPGEAFMGGIRRALEKGKDIERELKMDTWPNGPRWLWSRYNIMRDAQGAGESVVFFAHDITTQKLAEMKLKESEENYRQLVETAGLVMAIWDLEGKMQFVNGLGAKFLHRKAEEVLGKHITEVFGPVIGGAFLRDMQKIVETGFDDEHVTEMPLPGGVRWFWSRGSLLHDSTGKITGVAVFARDVTEERLAQQKVRDSEEKYRHFIEECGLIVLSFSPDGRFTFVNAQGAQFLDRAIGTIVGSTVEEVFGQEFGKVVRDRVAYIARTGKIDYYEDRVTTPKSVRWVLGHPSILRDADGRVTNIVAHVHDITEHKRAQEELHASEERYKQLMETSGISVTCFDKELRITLANSVSAARFQRQPEEIVGKRMSEILASPWCDEIEVNIRKVFDSGQVSEREIELIFPVGRRWFWSKASPLRDALGEVTGVMVFAHDITEQKLAELALQESESRRRMLTEMAMEGIFMHEDGVLLEANPRYFEMFGYKPEELIGKQARDITLTPESLRMLKEHISTGRNKWLQVTAVRKDGSQFPCEIYGLGAVYKGRNVRVGMSIDISERVRAETELAQMQEKMCVAERLAAVGYMGATMAHEINTPLSVMKLTAQMLIDDLEKSKRVRADKDQARIILNEIDHASEIVNRYRELSRPSRGVDEKSSDIQASLKEVINLLRKTAERAKLQLLIEPQVPELLAWLGSTDRAEQLLLILIENAIQATDGKTWRKLEIAGALKDGNVEIRFIDNCCGIPPEDIQKIFEPFFSTKPRNAGTGLGLSIVRRLLQEQGGQIKVESQVGKGTTFIITYPA